MTGVRGSRLGNLTYLSELEQDALPFFCQTNYLCLNKFLCSYPQIFLKSPKSGVFYLNVPHVILVLGTDLAKLSEGPPRPAPVECRSDCRPGLHY